MNRSNVEIQTQLQNLQSHNDKIVNAIKTFQQMQMQRFDTLTECDEDEEDERDSEPERDQENLQPNYNQQYQSKALINLLKSNGIKIKPSAKQQSKGKPQNI